VVGVSTHPRTQPIIELLSQNNITLVVLAHLIPTALLTSETAKPQLVTFMIYLPPKTKLLTYKVEALDWKPEGRPHDMVQVYVLEGGWRVHASHNKCPVKVRNVKRLTVVSDDDVCLFKQVAHSVQHIIITIMMRRCIDNVRLTIPLSSPAQYVV